MYQFDFECWSFLQIHDQYFAATIGLAAGQTDEATLKLHFGGLKYHASHQQLPPCTVQTRPQKHAHSPAGLG